MKIGVVIPCYNSERFVSACIDSIKAQSIGDWHAVIVDDGSKDDSTAVVSRAIENDARFTLIRQANAGVAHARNRGFAAVRDTEAVLFLDNDDRLAPDALDLLSRLLESHPNAPAVAGLPGAIDANGSPMQVPPEGLYGQRRVVVDLGRGIEVSGSGPVGLETFAVWSCIETPGQVLIRRSALGDAFPFDQATAPSDDWDLWLRLSLSGPLLLEERVTLWKRDHGLNAAKTSPLMRDAESRCRRKWRQMADSGEMTDQQRATLRRGHALACRLRLRWHGRSNRGNGFMTTLKSLLWYLRAVAVYRRVWS